MEKTLPYISAYGNIEKCLDRIMDAQTPKVFSQDFLATYLNLTGGGARPVIKYLKNLGFLTDGGVPTELYHHFRAERSRGVAAVEALRIGYADLFEHHEYANRLNDDQLKDLIISVLQCASDDRRIPNILKSFNNVKKFADFDSNTNSHLAPDNHGLPDANPMSISTTNETPQQNHTDESKSVGLNLAYTVNLNLPESTNPEVFNAIFKSLKENLLKND